MNICFIEHASEWPLFQMVSDHLSDLGMRMLFVNKTRETHRRYEQNKYPAFSMWEVFEQAKMLTEADCRRIDKKYGLPGIQSVCNSDLHLEFLFPGDREAQARVVAAAYMFWEAFFSEHDIKYVLSREVATFATRTARTVALARGIPASSIAIGPGSGLFLMGDMGKTSMWSELEAYIQAGVFPLTNDQEAEVRRFISQRLPSGQTPMILRFVPPKLLVSLRQLVGLWRYDTDQLRIEDPIRVAALRYGRQLIRKRLLWKYFTQHLFPYDELNADEDFVYFPFYSGLETGYLTDDHFWARHEIELIHEVASSLPVGVKLYVKEHPHNPGDFTYAELKRIRSHPNVRVLHPSFSSQYLVERSKAVFVLQGTAGWEALLSQKPVVSVGTSFFSYSPLVHRVDRISEVADVLNRALNSELVYTAHQSEWLWFIYGVVTTCFMGSIVNLVPPYGFVTDDQNARRIADQVANKITRDLS